MAASPWRFLSEEAPFAYKDPAQGVRGVGLSRVVARLRPVGVVKAELCKAEGPEKKGPMVPSGMERRRLA